MTRYVLITPARNEDGYIERTLRSVIAQTQPPERWVIVSDGSTDRTDEIASRYAASHPFIRLLRIEEETGRNFACQVYATNAGYRAMSDLEFGYVGILDADITFAADYYARLLEECEKTPRLGIAGGAVIDVHGDRLVASRAGSEGHHVAGGVQLFRRACYDEIGGYVPMGYGGQDVVAEVAARMKGWEVRTFPGIPAYHQRPGPAGWRGARARFTDGVRNYVLGTHPLYQFGRCFRRTEPLDGLVAMAGYTWSLLRRDARPVPPEFVRFLREEQLLRLRGRLLHFGPRRENTR